MAFLAFIGFIFNYMLRVNINLTIVSMVNFTEVKDEGSDINECNVTEPEDDGGKGNDGEFMWDSVVQSQIIGSFYYGYILTQVPGGRLSEVIGAKRVLGISMGGVAILKYFIGRLCHLPHSVGFYQKYCHFWNCASVASWWTFLSCFIHFLKLDF